MLHTRTIEMSRLYYDEGWTMQRIAEHFNVYPSTVCTAIRRLDKRQCPIGTLCKNCKMPECIIKPKYQHIINHGEQTKGNQTKGGWKYAASVTSPVYQGNTQRYRIKKETPRGTTSTDLAITITQ